MICKSNKISNTFKKLINIIKESRVFIAIVGLFLIGLSLSIMSPYFLTVDNILNVLRQISIIAVISIGMTYVIITGGIDLSVGSVLALSAVIAAISMKNNVNMYLSIIIGLCIGSACGFINGLLIATKINMPPFIATLSMMSICRGLSMVLTGGAPIYGLSEQFGFIAGGYIFGIPLPVIIMIFLYVISHIYLVYVRTGKYYYAVGGNQEAARVAGVDVRRIKISAYTISGLTSAIGGIMLASRLVSIEPLSGTGYELDAIAATVIGGSSLYGGEGNVMGTIVGAVIMGILRNGMVLLGVSPYWQQVMVGVVIAIVVSLGTIGKK